MNKFKPGDVIEPIVKGSGFMSAKVVKVYTETQGIHKGKEMYLLKIPNGTATMSINAEVNYKLMKK